MGLGVNLKFTYNLKFKKKFFENYYYYYFERVAALYFDPEKIVTSLHKNQFKKSNCNELCTFTEISNSSQYIENKN